MFPPLALALAVTLLATTIIDKLKIGRFMLIAKENNVLAKYYELIEQECESIHSRAVITSSMWMVVTISCLFYTLFLFDTLGDSVGFGGAYWVLVVMPLMPAVLYFAFYVFNRREKKTANVNGIQPLEVPYATQNVMHNDAPLFGPDKQRSGTIFEVPL